DSPKLTIQKLPAIRVSSDARSNRSTPFSRVSALAQGRISATVGRDMPSYQMQTKNGGFRAENAQNGLTTDFALHSVEVRSGNTKWAMALQGYGYGSMLKMVDPAAPKANFNRLEYERGALTEWYVNGPAGLEQGFTIRQMPGNGKGEPLTIALSLTGDHQA